jgi:alpha-beta hydrolase superfamily lysophospholipase
MTKKILILLILISGSLIMFCQNKSIGYWIGTMKREGSTMDVSFEFNILKNQPVGYFNSATQRASGIPLDEVTVVNDSLTFHLMTEPISYFKCKVSLNSINGQIIQEGFSKGYLSLKRSLPPVKSFTSTDTTFKSDKAQIACRIYFPKSNGKFPAVVFMHGSGGEGMFANQYLAEYLASKGIIALIQDKRGVGKSTGNWTTASFDELATDHIQAVNFLKGFEKVNTSQIGIYGHSQGGTIAPLVASKSKDIAFIIAASGIGDTVFKQDVYRTENNLKSNGFTQKEVKEAIHYYKSWLDMARLGNGFEKLDSLNQVSKNKKWFEWVEAPIRDNWIWKFYLLIGNYNSLDYWKKINIPVFLIYGENDQIEDIRSYIFNIDNVLTEQAHNKDLTQIILPKAQHNLCISPEKNEKFFWWYLSPGYPDLIAGWIEYRFKN